MKAVGSVNVTTVADNKRYSDRQLKEAEIAINLIHRIKYPSVESVMKVRAELSCVEAAYRVSLQDLW